MTRADAGHLAFTLLARFPQLRLAAPPDTLVRTPGLLMNGFAALPVLLGGPHVR
jgi:hypothetical protein